MSMKNYFYLDGIGKVPMSDETAENLKKKLDKKEDLIDEKIKYVRISETKKDETNYPVRVSILDDYKQGLPAGEFDKPECGTLPGYTLTIEGAVEVRDAIDKIIQKHEKKDC